MTPSAVTQRESSFLPEPSPRCADLPRRPKLRRRAALPVLLAPGARGFPAVGRSPRDAEPPAAPGAPSSLPGRRCAFLERACGWVTRRGGGFCRRGGFLRARFLSPPPSPVPPARGDAPLTPRSPGFTSSASAAGASSGRSRRVPTARRRWTSRGCSATRILAPQGSGHGAREGAGLAPGWSLSWGPLVKIDPVLAEPGRSCWRDSSAGLRG